MNNYMQFIHKSRYARWLPEENRRENWEERVERYVDFFEAREGDLSGHLEGIRKDILNLEVAPSMRCLMTAGKALDRDNVAGFNCSYVAVDNVRVFDEIMYVLMCGTGVGFSVERQYVSKLPEIAEEIVKSEMGFVVRDSKLGWCKAFRSLVHNLYAGEECTWDLSKIRPSGTPLKTFGGRASGPEPLEDLFKYTVALFRKARGRKLSSIECHDLVCKVASIVVVGGVRRSALISLSNLSDDRMRIAKSGAWWDEFGHRALANNSACYTEKPSLPIFMKEWESLYESKSGERGIFSRVASQKQAARNNRRDHEHEFGTNPCSEIILRSKQFCNLSEVVCRPHHTFSDLKRLVRSATLIGTLQSTLTNFRYLSTSWKQNTDEERLLGVSLTGIMDHPYLSGSKSCEWWSPCGDFQGQDFGEQFDDLPKVLQKLKQVAIDTNKEWAEKLGIPQSTAITCVKPSGTVSQLVDCASGIHSRFAPYYIRTVRGDVKDPLSKLMIEQGVPNEPCVMNPQNTVIFSFPQKAPEGSKMVKDDTAMEQLELWKIYQEHWCEHKPSVTVYYDDSEFLGAGAWVYENFDAVSGVSFLPRSEHTYAQAPYQEITEEEFHTMSAAMPDIDWDRLAEFENTDMTSGSQTMACSGSVCEMVDLT
jgi:ribonucleoside-diphosphate reductase alpha chain